MANSQGTRAGQAIKVGQSSWIDQELDERVFKDARLGRRLRGLLAQFAQAPGRRIPLVCQDWANTPWTLVSTTSGREPARHPHKFRSSTRRYVTLVAPFSGHSVPSRVSSPANRKSGAARPLFERSGSCARGSIPKVLPKLSPGFYADMFAPAPLRPTRRLSVAACRIRLAIARLSCALVATLAGCGAEKTGYEPTFSAEPLAPEADVVTVAVHPLHGPQKLVTLYQPLVDYLNTRIPGTRFALEASSSYGAFEQKLRDRKVHVALPNPYQTVMAEKHGYRVIAKVADDRDFRGLILVRKDGGVQRPTDLNGKSASFPAPTALAATLLPQRWLHDHGVDMGSLTKIYAGTQESSILNLVLGKTTAAGTWPQAWRSFQQEQPHLASQVMVKWETEPLVNNSIMVRPDVNDVLAAKIREALLSLATESGGRSMLSRMEIRGFEAADAGVYDKVRLFVRNFERDIRPVGWN
ncbi:PhnD/SsuA/transferrin family substrate-binding protein [Aquabacterium sp. A7-Y]|uniref:PhnD/SsuA/transferrin family substrate-binding protein n=1 Tax=Aquabacterium sp. A7-Y TaxID=1349605 RepID=UPI00223E2F1B|nr:PhnD/SsuA/transferrin family substrate-binding protein [Aquabacterium sp. A7-Y]MCW7540648.1 PhnD/SsuA/transferrin family substrate-binding protein [Aquabacterium sp. A7-Y]